MEHRVVAVGAGRAAGRAGEPARAGVEAPARPGMDRLVVMQRHMAERPEVRDDAQQRYDDERDHLKVDPREVECPVEDSWCTIVTGCAWDGCHTLVPEIENEE